MDPKDIVSFCQKEFHEISFAAFDDMRKKGELCDVTIRAKNRSFAAHRVVLAAGIPYFRSFFAGATEKTEEKDICVDDFDPRVFGSLIDFAYSSKVVITTENVQSLCLASQFLQLNEVRDACVEFMTKRFSINSIMQVRALAYRLDNMNFFENTNSFITDNFEEFSKTTEFLNLPYSSVKEIIMKDDLRVSGEETVFRAVTEWVKALPEERKATMVDLLSEVRMIFLPVNYLVEQVASEELVRTSKVCSDLVDEVKNYQLLPEKRTQFSKLKMRPRENSTVIKAGIYGICQDPGLSVSVHYCDFEKGKWHHLASSFNNGNILGVVGVNQKLYLFLEETAVMLDPKTHAWEVLKPRHKYILGSAILALGNTIYFFGSWKIDFMKKLRFFCTKSNTWLPEGRMEMERRCSSASSVGDYVYLSGGVDSTGSLINSVERFCPGSEEFTKVSPMLIPRASHCSCGVNEKVYVCGGIITKDAANKPEVYDTVGDQWTFIASVRMHPVFSLLSNNNKIFAFGHDNSFAQREVIEIYDPSRCKWQRSFCICEGLQYAVVLPP